MKSGKSSVKAVIKELKKPYRKREITLVSSEPAFAAGPPRVTGTEIRKAVRKVVRKRAQK